MYRIFEYTIAVVFLAPIFIGVIKAATGG